MLELNAVTKSIAGQRILHPTHLRIETGQITVLIGPSGCGKSTLLRLMIGLIEPDEGSIALDGVPICRDNVFDIRKRMGYVIQDGGLFPHLTASENVTLMARHLGQSKDDVESRLRELASLTHFPANAFGKYPQQLSGGQRQRVGLMRALMLDPEVLLLDEPLGALDPVIRSELQHDLRTIFQSLGNTVVLVTHDIGEAGYFSDSIVLIRGGRILQHGALEDLVLRPADPYVTQFINAQRSPLESIGAVS